MAKIMQLTGRLRWAERVFATQVKSVLQQEWRDQKTGKCEWVDVPTATLAEQTAEQGG